MQLTARADCVPDQNRHQILAGSGPFEEDWSVLLEQVLNNPDLICPAFQPIFDLERGSICGYETLARFKLATWHSPVDWLEAAAERGLQDPFEAALLEAALRDRAWSTIWSDPVAC